MDDGEQFPDEEEDDAEDDNSGNDTQHDGEDGHRRGTILVLLDPDGGVVGGLVVEVLVVEGAVVGWVDKLARSRLIHN